VAAPASYAEVGLHSPTTSAFEPRSKLKAREVGETREFWEVRRSYKHNKHINAIRMAQDEVEHKHEGSSQGGDVLAWP
jgi:hypothetical protein